MKKIWNRLKPKNFTLKLVTVFVITILTSLIFITLFTYVYSRKILENKTYDYMQNLAAVTMSKVETSVENIEDIAFYISGNDTIRSSLSREADPAVSRQKAYDNYRQVRTLLSGYALLRPDINSIYLRSVNDKIYSYAKSRQYLDFDTLDKNAAEQGERATELWLTTEDEIFLQKQVYQIQGHKHLGTLVIEVNAPIFYDIIKDITYDNEGQVYIIDRNNKIIAGQNQNLTGRYLPDAYQSILTEKPEQMKHVTIDGKSYTVYEGVQISNGWRMVMSVPSDYMLKDIRQLRNYMAVILLAIGVLVCGLIILVSRSMTRPIYKLSRAMAEFGQGNFETNCLVESSDEIGALSQSFNQMVNDMKTLINQEYEQKVMRQKAEMKSLQMQINPHFLYNTLDTMNWMARAQGLDEVGEMSSALGSLMRYSLSRRAFVTIREELENLNNYIEIQNVRYGDKMSVQFEVAPDVSSFYLPKLLIQPILENAIIHGVEDKLEPSTILIRIYREEDDLYILIQDDGVGMTQNAIEKIIDAGERTESQKHTSIGIGNVNSRIRNVYGEDCGLQIQSELGAGTKITLHLKALSEIPENL